LDIDLCTGAPHGYERDPRGSDGGVRKKLAAGMIGPRVRGSWRRGGDALVNALCQATLSLRIHPIA